MLQFDHKSISSESVLVIYILVDHEYLWLGILLYIVVVLLAGGEP